MINIKIKFNYNGKKYKFAAVLTDSYKLSDHKVNESVICENDHIDGSNIWSLFFTPDNDYVFEVVFPRINEKELCFEPEWINVWDMEDEEKIVDEFGHEKIKCTVKRY